MLAHERRCVHQRDIVFNLIVRFRQTVAPGTLRKCIDAKFDSLPTYKQLYVSKSFAVVITNIICWLEGSSAQTVRFEKDTVVCSKLEIDA